MEIEHDMLTPRLGPRYKARRALVEDGAGVDGRAVGHVRSPPAKRHGGEVRAGDGAVAGAAGRSVQRRASTRSAGGDGEAEAELLPPLAVGRVGESTSMRLRSGGCRGRRRRTILHFTPEATSSTHRSFPARQRASTRLVTSTEAYCRPPSEGEMKFVDGESVTFDRAWREQSKSVIPTASTRDRTSDRAPSGVRKFGVEAESRKMSVIGGRAVRR